MLFLLQKSDGICHVYVDKSANLEMARQIVLDAKTDYPAGCNAMVI
jgi:delta-1-pyrroline-5-carboxylate synthetase